MYSVLSKIKNFEDLKTITELMCLYLLPKEKRIVESWSGLFQTRSGLAESIRKGGGQNFNDLGNFQISETLTEGCDPELLDLLIFYVYLVN